LRFASAATVAEAAAAFVDATSDAQLSLPETGYVSSEREKGSVR